MTMFDLSAFAKAAHAHIHGHAALPVGCTEKTLLGGKLKAVCHDPYTVIQQNPDSGSTYATKAKAGHEVSWLIKDNPKFYKGTYLSPIVDGNVERNIGGV